MSEITLVELVEKTGTELKKQGKEWRGCCPIHGGKNPSSFVIRPGSKGLIWTCYSKCNTYGGTIKFVMMMWRLSWSEAIEKFKINDLPKPNFNTPISAPSSSPPPPDLWQKQAQILIMNSINHLWSKTGERAINWLNQRGLTNDTIKHWGLGYIPQEKFEPIAKWGLNEKGKKSVWLPRGILIPILGYDHIWGLKIRRPVGNPKIPQILGSRPALFEDINLNKIVFITEGEFDAMLLHQEVGDLIGIATMGAAGHLPKGMWINRLIRVEKIFVAGDNDPAGRKHNAKWQRLSSRVLPACIPLGNDLTDYWQEGGNLRDWVKYILAKEKPMSAYKAIPINQKIFPSTSLTQTTLFELPPERILDHYDFD